MVNISSDRSSGNDEDKDISYIIFRILSDRYGREKYGRRERNKSK